MIPYHYDRHLSNIYETVQVSTIHMMHAFWGNYDKDFKYSYAHIFKYVQCIWWFQLYLLIFQAFVIHFNLSHFSPFVISTCIHFKHFILSSICLISPPLSSTKRRTIQQCKCGKNSSKFHTNLSNQYCIVAWQHSKVLNIKSYQH